MKKIWIRWGVIIVVFFLSLVIFSVVLNQGTTDMTIDMQGATLPVISVLIEDQEINLLHGYVDDMDEGTIRDVVTPIGDNRNLDFKVNTYGTDVSRLSYEVRSKDGTRLIEENNIGSYDQKWNTITGSIVIKDLIEENIEYNLCMILHLGDGRDVRYYTRIIQNEDANTLEKIEFVKDFNNKTFNKDLVRELSIYMEPNSDGDNTSFGNVNIHSSMSQLSWGDMQPKKVGSENITIHEIGDKIAYISMEYMVSVKADKIINYYRVEEFYRIRKSSERFYLLSFDRTMNDIFVMDKESLANNKIVIGICDEPTQMMESSDGNIVVFENLGRLYSYNITENKLARLFAFYDELDVDVRNTYDKSKIKILNVEEGGNVYFLVYGYFNRGTHEGETGVMLDYYNSQVNTIEEQVFIPYDKSPEVLMADVDKLSYLNTSGMLYVYIDGAIFSVDVDSLELERVDNGIREETFFVSKSHRTAVWQSGSEYDLKADVNTLNLIEGTLSTIEKQTPGDCIKLIGFMNEDLIYGVSHVDDVIYNTLGDITFPMDKIVIQSSFGTVLKEYEFDDVYVTEGDIVDNQINMKRVKKLEDGSFVEIEDDQITNNDSAPAGKNKEGIVATDLYEKVAQIELKSTIDTKSLKLLTPKEVLFEGGRKVKPGKTDEKERFYLYDKGRVTATGDNPALLIANAVSIRGTVLDNYGNTVYIRGDTVARNQIMAIKEESVDEEKNTLAVCLDNMLKLQGISRNTEILLNRGDSPQDILTNNLPTGYVLNLTGANMDTVMYFLNRDIPVMALLNNGQAILLVGYNEQNMVWFDPAAGTIYKKGMTESREILEENGNRFLTYSTIDED